MKSICEAAAICDPRLCLPLTHLTSPRVSRSCWMTGNSTYRIHKTVTRASSRTPWWCKQNEEELNRITQELSSGGFIAVSRVAQLSCTGSCSAWMNFAVRLYLWCVCVASENWGVRGPLSPPLSPPLWCCRCDWGRRLYLWYFASSLPSSTVP
jgi:hypothetical protein